MSENWPPALLAHLSEPVVTVCTLIRFELQNGQVFGLAQLDRDVEVDGVTYRAATGADRSLIATDTGLSVDNAEAYALLATDVPGITLEMVQVGEMDNAQWEMLLVNYEDLSMGYAVLDGGDVGRVTVKNNMVYMPELLSRVMRLRQAIGGVWSRACRAIFGTPPNSQTGCGVNADALWVAATVTAIADEPDRVFACDALALDPVPIPGRVRFTSGRNAGPRLYQIEAYSPVSGTVALLEPLPYPAQEDDELELRVDCPKTPAACKFFGNWPNYKGEPLIPVGDGLATLQPGADLPTFSGSEVIDDDL